MDYEQLFGPGDSLEEVFTVEERHTARHLGSGAVRVLATPAMIAWMETVSLKLLAQHLPEGSTSVGVLVNIRHLAPTPVGGEVRVRAEITAVKGRQVTFQVDAWDNLEQAGSGAHERAIIDEARFMRRIEAKSGEA